MNEEAQSKLDLHRVEKCLPSITVPLTRGASGGAEKRRV